MITRTPKMLLLAGKHQQLASPTKPLIDFRWLGRYAFLLLLEITGYAIATCYYYAGTIRASRNINDLLVDSVLSSTLRYVLLSMLSRSRF